MRTTNCLARETGLVGPLTPHWHIGALTWLPAKGSVYLATTVPTLVLFATGVRTLRNVGAVHGLAVMGHLNRN